MSEKSLSKQRTFLTLATLDTLLPSDRILPSQFFPSLNSLSPERLLFLSVLCGAVNDMRMSNTRKIYRNIRQDTEVWIKSDDTKWPFSFVNVCNVLGFDVSYLRNGLLRIPKRKVEPLDWTKYTIAKCSKPGPCDLCSELIQKGEMYYNRHGDNRAHIYCGQNLAQRSDHEKIRNIREHF